MLLDLHPGSRLDRLVAPLRPVATTTAAAVGVLGLALVVPALVLPWWQVGVAEGGLHVWRLGDAGPALGWLVPLGLVPCAVTAAATLVGSVLARRGRRHSAAMALDMARGFARWSMPGAIALGMLAPVLLLRHLVPSVELRPGSGGWAVLALIPVVSLLRRHLHGGLLAHLGGVSRIAAPVRVAVVVVTSLLVVVTWGVPPPDGGDSSLATFTARLDHRQIAALLGAGAVLPLAVVACGLQGSWCEYPLRWLLAAILVAAAGCTALPRLGGDLPLLTHAVVMGCAIMVCLALAVPDVPGRRLDP